MTADERDLQIEAWSTATAGSRGYLREAYHGEPYATRCLVAEAFASGTGECRIPALVLRERLPEVLKLATERERALYDSCDEDIASVLESYRRLGKTGLTTAAVASKAIPPTKFYGSH
jgi:hypothetical protein